MDCVEAVSKNQKAISSMCLALKKQDAGSTAVDLSPQQWRIAHDLRKILDIPRDMMAQFMGDQYAIMCNVDLGVSSTLEYLALAKVDPDICPEVRDLTMSLDTFIA